MHLPIPAVDPLFEEAEAESQHIPQGPLPDAAVDPSCTDGAVHLILEEAPSPAPERPPMEEVLLD